MNLALELDGIPKVKITSSVPVNLADKYLDDYIIDMKDFDNINNISCHQEIKINLKLNEK